MGSECQNCGQFVSDSYARVFGDNDDEVHRCFECGNQNGSEGEKRDRANIDRVESGGVV